jgi:pantoate kinase
MSNASPNLSTVGAYKAAVIFQQTYGCKPCDAPQFYAEWIALLNKHKSPIERTRSTSPKLQPISGRTQRVLELLKASPKPLSLVEVSAAIGEQSSLVQDSLRVLCGRHQITVTKLSLHGKRGKLIYSAVEDKDECDN